MVTARICLLARDINVIIITTTIIIIIIVIIIINIDKHTEARRRKLTYTEMTL